ncbi:oxygen-independent coproporphyrinogen-3 oxidase [Lachnospiraceae bacterium XBB2008]|nr:oxygen-independent coproporphyrinogen-3 oxidase [Lachnospiraceae bacterium XBB2008]
MKKDFDSDKFMIVRVDTPGLQYDINAIVKAFYPDREVRVLEPDSTVHDSSILDLPVYMDIEVPSGKDGNGHSDDPSFGHIRVEGTDHGFGIDPEIGPKNSFKLALYDTMCKITGRTLPWGNLTGVRPTKIAMTRIRSGENDARILEFMRGYHRVSDEKSELAVDIAHRELDLLEKLDHRNGYSLYIGIPFCPTTCLYCSFTSSPIGAWRDRVDTYLEALYKEIDYVADASGRGVFASHPDTIYIGGGTPTSLDEEHLEKLLSYLCEKTDTRSAHEFTCEAGRPDSITAGKLAVMKKYGVTRISINPQTMQQKTLDIIGRRTTPDQVKAAFSMAREAGFDNINMDIILGLPGEGKDEVADTLEQISMMEPDSMTVHSLAIKRASALKQHLDEIGIEALKNTDETMALAALSARNMGMKPYYLYRQKNMSGNFENTGYCVPGRECLYNILIMEEIQAIVALGAGSISKRVDYPDDTDSDIPVNISRAENLKDIESYISRIDEMIERKKDLFEQQNI